MSGFPDWVISLGIDGAYRFGSDVDFSKLFEKYPLPKKREKFPEIMPTFKTLWTHKQQKS